MRCPWSRVAALAPLCLAAASSAQLARTPIARTPIAGFPIGGSVPPPRQTCLPLAERIRIQARIAANLPRLVLPPPGDPTDGPILYPFYPQGGTLYRDLTTGNFVDLDPTPNSVQNYLCEHYGNDAHEGCDSGSPTWEEMAIGMPIFAALDGTVVDLHDGDPDMNTSCEAGGNYVILDHGSGRQTWYLHMRRNTVAVTLGQAVRAGQQLGLVGSSGCSFAPHLHFQSMQNGAVYEPFAGACRPGPSGFVHQIDPPAAPYLKGFGVTSQDIGAAPPFPARPPVNAQITFADPTLYYWMQIGNLPANSTWHERYVRPDGSTEFELGPFPFNNPTTYQTSLYWFARDIGGMHSIAGTWRIQFDVNGAQLVDAPVEVVAQATQGFNRPPLPIAAAFDPPAPQLSDVVFARLTGPFGIRDLDWDIVRYHYVWKVNGATVRDLISVGMADALPRNTAQTPGDIVECTITPNDGHVDGAPITIRVAAGCYANCDAGSTPPRLNVNDFVCFQNRFAAGDPWANCDGSSIPPLLNVNDFVCFQARFAAGCP
jgi:murein DD-endopeptidase MepM/ murein hydrolase activator NlpD